MIATPKEFKAFFDSYKRKKIDDPALTRAGVLMPFFEKERQMHVLLTKRTDAVEHHKGQISFPGGAVDSKDTDIIATALREAEEEIGLPKESIEVLGLFDDFWTPTGFIITPVVGYVPSLPILTVNSEEVATILEVPVSLFLDKTKERTGQREREGKKFDLYFYDYGPHEIWGATAAILRSFLHEVSREAR